MMSEHIGKQSVRYSTGALSADASSQPLPERFRGVYFYDVYVKATADDAVTVSVADYDSRPLVPATATTGAIAGEHITISKYRQSFGIPTYTVSGIGAGTVTITFIGTI